MTTIVPVQLKPVEANQGGVEMTPSQVQELTFAEITVTDGSANRRITEKDLEEFARKNIEVFFPEEETLLIVGQQVRNKEGGRSDLVGVDDTGSVVLIEIKRDAVDMSGRKEATEFQAIRYAANYALIKTPDDLVQKLFAPYIERHKAEFAVRYPDRQGLSSTQLALEILQGFLKSNDVEQEFNQKQRIILIASSFDDQTLSACAWLSKNGIELQCFRVSPIKYGQEHFLVIEELIPPPLLDDYFVEIAESSEGKKKIYKTGSQVAKTKLPKMEQLAQWGIIRPGDKVHIRARPSDVAEVIDSKSVRYNDQVMGFNQWGQMVTGWSAINIYEWTFVDGNDKSLDELRRAKMDEVAAAELANSDGSS